MIAVDSSILVGLIRGEEDLAPLIDVPFREEAALAAPALVVAKAWCARNLKTGVPAWLNAVVQSPMVVVASFTAPMADAAAEAFRVMGKGSGHAAALDFGDALVYGHASVMGLPRLFKGSDFKHTDLSIDPRSVIL